MTEWLGDFDINLLSQPDKNDQMVKLVALDSNNQIQHFELVLGLIFAEYYNGLQNFLKLDEFSEEDPYFKAFNLSLLKIKNILDHLYFEIKSNLEQQQGEITYYYKLFLHILYEIESAIYFLKDVFHQEKDRVTDLLKRDVNKDRRKFERIYYEFNMSSYFEKLLSWFQERSAEIHSSFESLNLIYYVRRLFFAMVDREGEYAFYLMQLAKLHRKNNSDVLLVNQLFKDCEKLKGKIIDYEYENAKHILKTKNAHEAY